MQKSRIKIEESAYQLKITIFPLKFLIFVFAFMLFLCTFMILMYWLTEVYPNPVTIQSSIEGSYLLFLLPGELFCLISLFWTLFGKWVVVISRNDILRIEKTVFNRIRIKKTDLSLMNLHNFRYTPDSSYGHLESDLGEIITDYESKTRTIIRSIDRAESEVILKKIQSFVENTSIPITLQKENAPQRKRICVENVGSRRRIIIEPYTNLTPLTKVILFLLVCLICGILVLMILTFWSYITTEPVSAGFILLFSLFVIFQERRIIGKYLWQQLYKEIIGIYPDKTLLIEKFLFWKRCSNRKFMCSKIKRVHIEPMQNVLSKVFTIAFEYESYEEKFGEMLRNSEAEFLIEELSRQGIEIT